MDTTNAVGLAYPGDELDELDIQVEWHVVLGDDALLTSRKQQLKNEPNATILVRSAVHICTVHVQLCHNIYITCTHHAFTYKAIIMHLRLSSHVALSLDPHHVDPE